MPVCNSPFCGESNIVLAKQRKPCQNQKAKTWNSSRKLACDERKTQKLHDRCACFALEQMWILALIEALPRRLLALWLCAPRFVRSPIRWDGWISNWVFRTGMMINFLPWRVARFWCSHLAKVLNLWRQKYQSRCGIGIRIVPKALCMRLAVPSWSQC